MSEVQKYKSSQQIPKPALSGADFLANAENETSGWHLAIASASNDHRLGANEAPPAIISVFIGDQLSKVLDQLENIGGGKMTPQEKTDLKLNVVGKIPEILLDNTDRNRTSPFAFTGNKFELRAAGSASNCAQPMTVLNSAMAEQLIDFKADVDALIAKDGLKKEGKLIMQNMIDSYRIEEDFSRVKLFNDDPGNFDIDDLLDNDKIFKPITEGLGFHHSIKEEKTIKSDFETKT